MKKVTRKKDWKLVQVWGWELINQYGDIEEEYYGYKDKKVADDDWEDMVKHMGYTVKK